MLMRLVVKLAFQALRYKMYITYILTLPSSLERR